MMMFLHKTQPYKKNFYSAFILIYSTCNKIFESLLFYQINNI